MRIFGGLIGDMVESVTEPIEDLFTDEEVSKTNKNKQSKCKSKCNQVAKESKESDYSFNNMMDLIIDSQVDTNTKLTVLICFLKGVPELKRLTYGKDTYKRIKERLKIQE